MFVFESSNWKSKKSIIHALYDGDAIQHYDLKVRYFHIFIHSHHHNNIRVLIFKQTPQHTDLSSTPLSGLMILKSSSRWFNSDSSSFTAPSVPSTNACLVSSAPKALRTLWSSKTSANLLRSFSICSNLSFFCWRFCCFATYIIEHTLKRP